MSDDESIPDLVELLPIVSRPRSLSVKNPVSITEPESSSPVPITLITGYLGAGKSTLINYVLTAHHGYRIAVIVNEYGDSAGIEKSIIHSSDTVQCEVTDWLEFANGCICCSVKSDFVTGLEGLLQCGKNRFDYVFIETTGLANPGPIASALWTDVELESSVFLDSIITVVDSMNIVRQLNRMPVEGASRANETQQQLAYADLILLNKVDLVSVEDLVRIEGVIRTMNSTAEIQKTQKCSIDLNRILNRNAFISKELTLPNDGKRVASKELDLEYHSCQVGTFSVFLEMSIDLEKFENWLGGVLWEEGNQSSDIFRMKGVLNVKHTEHKYILQVVHGIYEISEGTEWKLEETRISQIVVIGVNLNPEEFRKRLQTAL